ncbi:MAG: hypothetical protein JRH18_12655 [Deltaproteobacteria bacterium]|nr:hypothetical protein [Deltaproteobacteria bacterium]MBW2152507.1 hypothetical protein [Deltaproteobacteria bacterium]
MRGMFPRRVFNLMLIVALVMFLMPPAGRAYEEKEDDEDKDKPQRLIVMAAEYPGVEVSPDEDEVSLDIRFTNRGRSDETVKVWIAEQPKDWKARIKTYRYTVKGVFVKSDDYKTLTFEAEPPKDVKPGDYKFRVKGETPDGKFKFDQAIIIKVKSEEEEEKEGSKDLELTVSYPVLRGPSDAKFEFLIEVDSKLDKAAVFDLFAEGPKDWDVLFKPRWEDKYISSLRLKEHGSQSVAVEVKPAPDAKAGEYPINVRVVSGKTNATAKLTTILTGTYDLKVSTPTGLLSLDARQGKTANVSINVENTGSAPNSNIKFLSFKPENWKVEIKPEQIPLLKPGEVKTVDVAITPYEEALVGDYSVNVSMEGEKVTKPIEFRVTVNASTAWGWIGIGIIAGVVLGLTGLFRWLGRR